MMKRSRLPKGQPSRPDARLKKQVVAQLKSLPTDRVKKYATMSQKSVAGNVVLSLTKLEAQRELASRQRQLLAWKKGGQALAPKKPILPVVKKEVGRAVELAGKGFQEYMKLLSGEKAREMEEWTATIGMKPKERDKVIAQMEKDRSEAEYDVPLGKTETEPESYKLSDVTAELQADLKKSKKELGL